jgi:hypothetical protein
MNKIIICLSAVFLLYGQTAYSQNTAWVLWSYLEISSVKGDTSSWRVEDAFEDLKICKAAAEQMAKIFTKGTEKRLIELNAGFRTSTRSTDEPPFTTITEKWLCLPGGTNPGMTVHPSSRGEESKK